MGKVKEAKNMADIFTKAYPTYKFKERKKLILDANFFNAGQDG